jgi:hypothetical protein
LLTVEKNVAVQGLLDPTAALQHRWAPVIEGVDIINLLVIDHMRLDEDEGIEQLARAYPGI